MYVSHIRFWTWTFPLRKMLNRLRAIGNTLPKDFGRYTFPSPALDQPTAGHVEIAEAKMRLATAQAQAEPFGTDDPVQIAMAICARMDAVNENGTIQEKRAALFDVLESLTVDKQGRGILKVKGGFPIQRVQIVDGIEVETPLTPEQQRFQDGIARVRSKKIVQAKMEMSS